jgi:hypothetical protein
LSDSPQIAGGSPGTGSARATGGPAAPGGDVATGDGPSASGHDPRVQALALAALGVVFGDIGTSPLYAMKEVFSEAYAVTATHDHVLGAVSLVLWALMLVVCRCRCWPHARHRCN